MANWFSNFLPFDYPLIEDGIYFFTPEHYFQAHKSMDRAHRVRVAEATTPRQAKRIGRGCVLRDDWEDIKIHVMEKAIEYKFGIGTTWRDKLMITGNSPIVEWNTWCDNFWGDCQCMRCINIPGQNHLGKIIMELRSKISLLSSNFS